MRIGAYQFKTGGDISDNAGRMSRAIREAADRGVRLLVFPECALCGYPPVEIPSVDGIDLDLMEECLEGLRRQAKAYGMYVAVGVVRKATRCYNSTVLLSPEGGVAGVYDKRALWGWDRDNFESGCGDGIFEVDGIRVAFRICFEVRFPEYFREAFRAQAELCIVSFCDVSVSPNPLRYDLLKAHLATRASENVMTLVAVNSVSQHRTAPTAVFSEEGIVCCEAPPDTECLLVYDYEKPAEPGMGAAGRKFWSEKLNSPQ